VRPNAITTSIVDLGSARAAGLVLAHLDEIARGALQPLKSGELHDVMLKPFEQALAGVRTLAVVADAPYDSIAFAGLWDARRARYLIEDYRLVSAPSAAFETTRNARLPRRRFGIVSASQRAAGEDLSRLYGGADVQRGEAATPSQTLEQLSESDVVHIAAPVIADAADPNKWRLILADEPGRRYSGTLSGRELMAANVHTRLVTFDPYGSGRGPAPGEATQRFARALLAAGVSEVVGPVAVIPSAGLDHTWLEFHRRVAAGNSAADSLREAQLAALADSNRRSGPWATLTVFSSKQ
jgi:CHAT domain-containing protein